MEWSAMVYILLVVFTVGFALCIRNREYVPMHVKGAYGPGEYPGFCREQARNLVAETGIYILLAGVSACRIAVGNDYWVYRDNFKLIMQERHVSSELGFNLIVRLIQTIFGYDKYLPVFGFFSLLTVFFFVKALHDQAEDYAPALFLLLTNGYYFNSLNSVRYYLALAIALYAAKYVLRGDYAKFILWVLAGAIFHKTILLVIPVYLVAAYLAKTGFRKWHLLIAVPGGALLVFGQDLIRKILFRIYPFYEASAFDNGRLSYINILKCLCVLALCVITYKSTIKDHFANRFYFILQLFGLIVFCCGGFIPEASRIAYYMVAFQVFLLPGVLLRMKKGWFKTLCTVGIIAAYGGYFFVMLYRMYDVNIRLLPYLNWIFN